MCQRAVRNWRRRRTAGGRPTVHLWDVPFGRGRPFHGAGGLNSGSALRQADAGAYVNFLGDEGEAPVRAACPGPTWERLAAIKARYDPANLFRLNQNIAPA